MYILICILFKQNIQSLKLNKKDILKKIDLGWVTVDKIFKIDEVSRCCPLKFIQ